MSQVLVIPEATRLSQSKASDPRVSAWVSANAGAGKTDVLSHRVVRLLLDGVPTRPHPVPSPSPRRPPPTWRTGSSRSSAEWVSLDDAKLSAAIAKIEGEQPSARGLPPRAGFSPARMETPGGLKIQTIHAFCERLLHLFPSKPTSRPRFQVLDDATAAEILAAARRSTF